jgi:signal peptidase I
MSMQQDPHNSTEPVVPSLHPGTTPPQPQHNQAVPPASPHAPAAAQATPALADKPQTHPKLAPPLKPAAQQEADQADASEEEFEEERAPSAILGVLKTIFSWIVLPGLIVLFLHSFVFQAFYVSGSSMNPGFQDGDYLIIDKVGFTLTTIKAGLGMDTSLDLKRGDVLVFRYPNSPGTFFIKRLIGLPGERVVLKNGKFTIYSDANPDGLELNEPYIDQSLTTQGEIDEVVEEGKYFVVGDNRAPNGSFDSREWGQLPRFDIVGVATARLLPINELGPLKHPTY